METGEKSTCQHGDKHLPNQPHASASSLEDYRGMLFLCTQPSYGAC